MSAMVSASSMRLISHGPVAPPDGDGDNGLDEVSGDDIRKPLDGRARALRLAHHVHDARQ